MERLQITDLNLLRITKVKDWAIYFDYDGKHYLLHGASELGEGSWADLFEKSYDANGKYHMRHMMQSKSSEYLKQEYIAKQKGNTIVYNQIDKEHFVSMLVYNNFAYGACEEKVKETEKKMQAIQKKIKNYEDKIRDLRVEYNRLLKSI